MKRSGFKPNKYADGSWLKRTPLKRNGSFKPRKISRRRTVAGDSSKAIKDECDQLVRDIIKLRDDRCFTCPRGRWGAVAIEVGHMYRRGIEVLRWNLLNCNGQCSLCNAAHETDPGPYHVAFIRKYGVDAYGQMETLSLSRHKHTYENLLFIRDGLRDELVQLKARAA